MKCFASSSAWNALKLKELIAGGCAAAMAQTPHMHDHMTLIEVTAQAEGDETVADHFAFDYEKVAADQQLVGADLFGVLAPRDLRASRPLRPHQWGCDVCGFKHNVSAGGSTGTLR